MAKKESETRVIFAELKSGVLRRIEIPSAWTISFGPVVVGAARNHQNGESPNVLRIYTDASRKNLVGVYRDVIAVSDERISMTEKVTKAKTKTMRKSGSNGQQIYTAEVRVTKWRDPYADESAEDEDDFDESALQIPANMKDDEDGG